MPSFMTTTRMRPGKKVETQSREKPSRLERLAAGAVPNPVDTVAKEISEANPERQEDMIDKYYVAAGQEPQANSFYRVLRSTLRSRYKIIAPAPPKRKGDIYL